MRRESGLDTRKNWCVRWVRARHQMKAEKSKNEETKKEGAVQMEKWKGNGKTCSSPQAPFVSTSDLWEATYYSITPPVASHIQLHFFFPAFHIPCVHLHPAFLRLFIFPFLFWRPPSLLPSLSTFKFSSLSSPFFLINFLIFLPKPWLLPSFFLVSSSSFFSSFLSPYPSSSPMFLVPSFFRFFPTFPLPPGLCIFPLSSGDKFTNGNRLAPVRNAAHIVPYLTKHLIFPGIIFWAAWPLKVGSVCCPESLYAATNIRCLLFQRNEGLSSKFYCDLWNSDKRREKFFNPSENLALFRRLSRS